MRVIELHKKQKATKTKAEMDALIKQMRKEDEKMVKGQFEFTEAEGGFFEFCYRIYPGEPIRTIQLLHGEVCDLPMGLIKLINGTKKKIRRYANLKVEQQGSGKINIPTTYETTSRIRFIPSEFL